MICAGVDVGSRTTKAVVITEEGIKGYSILNSMPNAEEGSRLALKDAIEHAGLPSETPICIVATGYGRVRVAFARKQVSEISCHARGSLYFYPTARTIIDMGGQDCKAISCDGQGRVVQFVMNDKCAAGTGRFIEVIAKAFDCSLEEIGDVSLEVEKGVPVSSVCTVFARSEALVLAREGFAKNSIIAGIHDALVSRVVGLVRRVRVERDLVITGGIAKNKGFVARLESCLGMKGLIPDEPQIVGAVGAALYAREEMGRATRKGALI